MDAPRDELFDTVADPGETRNRAPSDAAVRAQLLAAMDARVAAMTVRTAGAAPDPGTAEAIRALGYLSGASGRRAGTIDPKDGLALLDAARGGEAPARRRPRGGGAAAAARALREEPGQRAVPRPARARAGGRGRPRTRRAHAAARARPEPALRVRAPAPGGRAAPQGRRGPARQSYEDALALNPRLAAAWLALAEMAKDKGAAEERALLARGAEAGTESAALLTRLAQLELSAGALPLADGHLREATALTPDFPTAWLLWGAVAERQGRSGGRAVSATSARSRLAPRDPVALLHLGRLRLEAGRRGRGARRARVRRPPGTRLAARARGGAAAGDAVGRRKKGAPEGAPSRNGRTAGATRP